MKNTYLILVIMLIFFQSFCLADASDNAKCLALIKKMNKTGRLLKIKSDTIVEYVTWRATLCGLIPTGKGNVTALCDGQTANGMTAFFWEKKYRNKLMAGYRFCDPQ